MATSGRPAIDSTGAQTHYLPLDGTDQQLYDSLTYQYERNAFLDMIRTVLRAVTEEGRLFGHLYDKC